jgi:dolichol kinase
MHYNEYLFEVRRKMFHIVLGFTIIALYYFNILNPTNLSILILIGIPVCFLSKHYKIPVLQWFLNTFEREEYMKKLPGRSVIFFLTGSLIAMILFQKDIVIASLLILTIGDGISPIIGMSYGRIRHPFSNIKFIEGTLTGATVSIVVIMLFNLWGYIDISFWEAFLASFAAMFVEGIEIELHRDMQDDNLIIPLVAGMVIWLFRHL